MTPVVILKAQETPKFYQITKGKGKRTEIDYKMEPKNWLHPPRINIIKHTKENNDDKLQIFTDSSKNKHGVGPGVAIFIENDLIRKLMLKLDNRCSDNQAEQLAVVKALEEMHGDLQHIKGVNPKKVKIYTDSRITIDSINNPSSHNYLIEEKGYPQRR